MTRTVPWPARASWLAVGLFALPAVHEALRHHTAAVRGVAAVELWALWTVALVATLVPRSLSLTIYRSIAPLTLVATGWSASAGASAGWAAVGVSAALVATAVAFSRSTVDAFVDGSSYGPEQRFALRVPAYLLLGPVPLSWAAATVWLAGPLLLAAQQWAAGAAVTVLGLALARPAARSLHGLARRWVVFVPAGFVLHDPLVLADAILLPRRQVASVSPALAGSTATDLTQRALGLALEVRLTEPVELTLRHGRVAAPTSTVTDRVLFTPLRPGALLDAAESRRMRAG